MLVQQSSCYPIAQIEKRGSSGLTHNRKPGIPPIASEPLVSSKLFLHTCLSGVKLREKDEKLFPLHAFSIKIQPVPIFNYFLSNLSELKKIPGLSNRECLHGIFEVICDLTGLSLLHHPCHQWKLQLLQDSRPISIQNLFCGLFWAESSRLYFISFYFYEHNTWGKSQQPCCSQAIIWLLLHHFYKIHLSLWDRNKLDWSDRMCSF